MANLYIKGSRTIPLSSKEAKKLLSQSGLSLILHTSTNASEDSQRPSSIPESTNTNDTVNQSQRLETQREGGELYCQSCRVALGDREEQLIHYRLDWHRYNLKRRLKGQASLSQEEFEKIAGARVIEYNYGNIKDYLLAFVATCNHGLIDSHTVLI